MSVSVNKGVILGVIHGTKATITGLRKDLLIVEEGLMTRLRAKMVKETMGLVFQAAMDEMSILANGEQRNKFCVRLG